MKSETQIFFKKSSKEFPRVAILMGAAQPGWQEAVVARGGATILNGTIQDLGLLLST